MKWSCCDWVNTARCMTWANLMFHCLEACLRPYNDLVSLHTFLVSPLLRSPVHNSPWLRRPWGRTIKISSSRSPWRKALVTSNWYKGQLCMAATLKRHQSVDLRHWRKGIMVVNAMKLSIPLRHKPSLKTIHRAIRIILDFIHPFVANWTLP